MPNTKKKIKKIKNKKLKKLKIKNKTKKQKQRVNQRGGFVDDITPEDLEIQTYFMDPPRKKKTKDCSGIYGKEIMEFFNNNQSSSSSASTGVNSKAIGKFSIDAFTYMDNHNTPKIFNVESVLNYQIFLAINYIYAFTYSSKINYKTYENFYFIDFQNLLFYHLDVSIYNCRKDRMTKHLIQYINNLASKYINNLYIYVVATQKTPIEIDKNVVRFGLNPKEINNDSLNKYIDNHCNKVELNNNDNKQSFFNMDINKTKNFLKYLTFINIIDEKEYILIKNKKISVDTIKTKINSYFKKINNKYFFQGNFCYNKESKKYSERIPFFKNFIPYDPSGQNYIKSVTDDKYNITLSYIDEPNSGVGFGNNSTDDILLLLMANYVKLNNDKNKKIFIVSDDKFNEFSNVNLLGTKMSNFNFTNLFKNNEKKNLKNCINSPYNKKNSISSKRISTLAQTQSKKTKY